MSLTSSLITGRIPLPTGEAFAGVKLIFTLSAWDREGEDILLPAALTVSLDEDGALPGGFRLWRNSEGLHGTHYTVLARWEEADRARGSVPREASLGTIQIGAAPQHVLGDLLGKSLPSAPSSFWVQASQAEVATILEASEGLAGFTAPGYLAAVGSARDQAQTGATQAATDAGRALAARIATEAAAGAAQSAARTLASWSALAALPTTGLAVGTGAEVLDSDTGSHSDPVAGGTVANAGRYSWSASPAGWQRIGETGLSGKVAASGSSLTDLFALAEWSPGYLAIGNGGVVNDGSGNWEMSQLMRMEAGVSLAFDISAHNAVAHIACYSASGSFIAGQAGLTNNPTPRQGSFVTPAGTGLIRVCRASAIHPVVAARSYPNHARGPVPVTRYALAAPAGLAGSIDRSCRKIRRRPLLTAASKILLYGDSRFSADYSFAKDAFEAQTGASVYNGGYSGQSTAQTALNARLTRIWTYEPDVIIWLPGGNDDGAPGSVGTFDGSVSGESIVTPTNIAGDYAGTRFIQAVDHTVRKIQDYYYNIRARAALTGAETEAEKTAKIDAVKKPVLILCTDLPQKRSSGTYWSLDGSWRRKRDAIAEVGRRNNIHTVDLLEDLAWNMTAEPAWTSPTNMVTNNGIYTMDGLHPNKYGHQQIAELICGDAGLM